jgi:hypothetical protein
MEKLTLLYIGKGKPTAYLNKDLALIQGALSGKEYRTETIDFDDTNKLEIDGGNIQTNDVEIKVEFETEIQATYSDGWCGEFGRVDVQGAEHIHTETKIGGLNISEFRISKELKEAIQEDIDIQIDKLNDELNNDY